MTDKLLIINNSLSSVDNRIHQSVENDIHPEVDYSY